MQSTPLTQQSISTQLSIPGRLNRLKGIQLRKIKRTVARKLSKQCTGKKWNISAQISQTQALKPIQDVTTTVVKFGFPKGSLQQSTVDLFERAGYTLEMSERSYFPGIDDKSLELVLFRSQEIPRYVEDGLLDAGICGLDWIRENDSDVVQVCELHYSKSTTQPAKWVIAVDDNSSVQTINDLKDGIIASELVNTTQRYSITIPLSDQLQQRDRFFDERGVKIKKVEFSWGATEVKARIPGVAAIVDITETGSSLQANKLRIIDTIMQTTAQLVANKVAWKDSAKRRRIEDLALLLQGAIEGRRKIGLKMNAPRDNLDQICSLVPASLSPTISPLVDPKFVAIEVVTDEKTARELVPQCQRYGAREILTYSLQSLISSDAVKPSVHQH